MNYSKGSWQDVNGTSLVGTITTTRRTIEHNLGIEPNVYDLDDPTSDGKVSTEWIVRFDDGLVATIYDWKRYEMGAPDLDEVYEWHVGGTGGNGYALRRLESLVSHFRDRWTIAG